MVTTSARQQVNYDILGSIPSLTLSTQFDKKNKTECWSPSNESWPINMCWWKQMMKINWQNSMHTGTGYKKRMGAYSIILELKK